MLSTKYMYILDNLKIDIKVKRQENQAQLKLIVTAGNTNIHVAMRCNVIGVLYNIFHKNCNSAKFRKQG